MKWSFFIGAASSRAAYIFIWMLLFAATTANAGVSAFVANSSGAAEFFHEQFPTATGAMWDELSGEEIALGSGALIQGHVQTFEASASKRYTLTLHRVLFSIDPTLGKRIGSTYQVMDIGPFILPLGSEPVLSLYLSHGHDGLGITHPFLNSVGYVVNGALSYRGPSRDERYAFDRGTSLFTCLAQHSTQGLDCRRSRLREFGVISRQQLAMFDTLAAKDTNATMLWFLIRHREPRATFPLVRCKQGVTSRNCASAYAFIKRLKFIYPA